MSVLDHRVPPPVVGATIGLVMWAVSASGPTWSANIVVRGILCGLLAIAGLSFELLGWRAFRAARTTVNPMKPERTAVLVTDGVYGLTRNPMYVGMACLLTAWAVWLSSAWAWIGPVLFVLYITRFQIQPEERVLAERFGDAYRTYRAQVRRWL